MSTSWKLGRFTIALRFAALMTLFALSAGVVSAQDYTNHCPQPASTIIDSIKPFRTVCAGDSLVFSVGYSDHDSIVLKSNEPTVSVPDTIFLPDGYPCGEDNSCVYSSTIEVSGYSGTIQSANDIKYVRLNLEHSRAGDINIRIICPNALHKATIFKLGQPQNTHELCYSIPAEECGWTGTTVSNLTSKFGASNNSYDSNNPCDPSAPGNVPGSGYDYCWSNSSLVSYSTLDDAIIYRKQGNETNTTNNIFNPSDATNNTNFYHPDEDFSSSLFGCSLSGEWTIEIVDGRYNNHHNGYLFDWEIVFDESLAGGGGGAVDSAAVLVPGDPNDAANWTEDNRFDRVDSTSFVFHAPIVTQDTTIKDTLRLYDPVGGCWYDTTISVLVTAPLIHSLGDSVICLGETITLNAGPCDLSGTQNSHLSQDFSAITTGGDRWHSHSHATAGGQIYYGPGNTEVDSFPDYVSAMLKFPERTKVFPAGGRVKLGNSEPATGSMTSVPLSLPHPFAVDVRAKGWGAVPGSSESPKRTRVNVVVDKGQPTQQVRTFETGPVYHWPGDSAYRDYSLLFDGASVSSTITVETVNAGSAYDTRAFVSYVGTRSTCTYSWSTGGTHDTIHVSPTATTTYTVTVTPAGGGCARVDTVRVVVKEPYLFEEPATACSGTPYVWEGHPNVSIPTTVGTHTVWDSLQTIGSPHCDSVYKLVLTVKELPDVQISGELSFCENGSTTLTADASAGVTEYSWSNNSSADHITDNTAGPYTVTDTNTDGCTASDSKHVTENELPTVQITGDTAFCHNGSTSLSAAARAGVTYHWSNDATTASITAGAAGRRAGTETDSTGSTRCAPKH